MRPETYNPAKDNNIMRDEINDLMGNNKNNFLKLKVTLQKNEKIKNFLATCLHFTDVSKLPLKEHMQKVRSATGFCEGPLYNYAIEYLKALENIDEYLSSLRDKINADNNMEKEYLEFQSFKKSYIEFRKLATEMLEFFNLSDEVSSDINEDELYDQLPQDQKNNISNESTYKQKINEKKIEALTEKQHQLKVEYDALNARAKNFLQSMDIELPQKIYATLGSFLIGCLALLAGTFVAMPFYLGKALIKQDSSYLKDAVTSPAIVPYYAAKKTYDDTKLGFIKQKESIFGKFGLYQEKANLKAEARKEQVDNELKMQIEKSNTELKG